MSLIAKISDLAIAIATDIKNLNANVNAFSGRVTTLEQTDSATNTRLQALESNTGGSLTLQEVRDEIYHWGVYRDVYAGSGWYKDANGRVYSKGVASGATKIFPNDPNTYINILDSDLTSNKLSTLLSGKVKPMFATSNLTKLSFDDYGSAASIGSKLSVLDDTTGLRRVDVSSWDVGHISNFDKAFYRVSGLKGLGNIDVSSMTSAVSMLESASISEDVDISKWDASQLVNAKSMMESFRKSGVYKFTGIDSFDTSSLTNAERMFYMADLDNGGDIDFSGWDVRNLINARGMFLRASFSSLFDDYVVKGFDDWRVGNVTNMDEMFGSNSKLVGDLSKWCVTNITSYPSAFSDGSGFEKLPVWGTCPYAGYGWYKDPETGIVECNGIADGETHQFEGDPKVYICFHNAYSLYDSNVENAATSNMTDMRNAFRFSTRMAGKNLSHLDLSNVTNMDNFASGSNFDGDLSNLHAPLIPSKPSGFLQGTPIENDLSKHPRWGV